ncbi:MAG: MscL family protein, partial [Ruminiclostridium sp.]|nr:MscL family protein [Ruminiclostridium sp.]
MAKENKANKATEKIGKVKFITEFKAFISRGNVLDMAVGMIVGSAFTAIIT